MTGFTVRPSALDRFGATLANGGLDSVQPEYLIEVGDYLDEWVELRGGAGGVVFQSLVDKTRAVHDQINSQNGMISTRLLESVNGLTASAAIYRKQERATAARLDSIYKTGSVIALDQEVDPKAAAVDPSAKLTTPVPTTIVPSLVQEILNGSGWLSEGELILKIIAACGFDAVDWVNEKFLGDFTEIGRVANAIQNLGHFDDAAATVVGQGLTTMLQSWQGHAASAAQNYFDEFSNALSRRATALADLAQKYELVLASIQQAASAIRNGITVILDAAIEAAATVAAAGCLEEVPIVDVVADVIAGYKVVKVLLAIRKFYTIWTDIWGGNEAMLGLITGLVGAIAGYDASNELPTLGYYNAAQGGPPVPYDDQPVRGGAVR